MVSASIRRWTSAWEQRCARCDVAATSDNRTWRKSRAFPRRRCRGSNAGVSIRTASAQRCVFAAALGVRVDVVPRWQGGDLDRLLNAGHSAMHEQVARMLQGVPGWRFVPEASFSIYGERGVVDVLAWHEAHRMLLVIELKTQIVDIQDLLATTDRKRRLASAIGRERGWTTAGAPCSVWVVAADTRTNRARLAAHVAVLRTVFPSDGRNVRGWLADPRRPLAALSFLQVSRPMHGTSALRGSDRVRRRRARPTSCAPST